MQYRIVSLMRATITVSFYLTTAVESLFSLVQSHYPLH